MSVDTICSHSLGTVGHPCPWCRTIVADDASNPSSAACGAVSAEGHAGLERSRPATIATGVASDRKAGGGPPPVCSAPVATIADPATHPVTPCPAHAAARDTLSAPAPSVAGSALNDGRGVNASSMAAKVGSPPPTCAPPSLNAHESGGAHRTPPRGDSVPVAAGATVAARAGGSPPPAATLSLFGARATDPDTAHDAAAAVSDVQRRNVYRAVLEALVEHGPSTDHDLARYVTGKLGHPIGQTSVGKRRGELRDVGYVTDSGFRGKTAGATAIRWGLTPAGIDAAGVAA